MSAELIPLLPATNDLQEFIDSGCEYSIGKLVRMSLDDLRALQRVWYDEAVRRNVIDMLHVAVRTMGELDQSGGYYVWREQIGNLSVDARLTASSPASLTIRVQGVTVCCNEPLGHELFKPGPWLQAVIDQFDRAQLVKRRAAERRELEEKQALITFLGADV